MISVSMADDHLMVLKGLQRLLEDEAHISVTGVYSNGGELLEGLKAAQPDVLILDINMPGMAGDELAHILSQEYPDLKILTLTNLDQSFHVQNMMHNGALGYLLKNTDKDTLVRAIETVYAGRQFIDAQMKEQMLQDMLAARKEEDAPVLSRREQEILQLIALEYTSQEIAEKLFLSQRTVENYRLNLLIKLDVKNTAGLVRKALQLGLAQ